MNNEGWFNILVGFENANGFHETVTIAKETSMLGTAEDCLMDYLSMYPGCQSAMIINLLED